MSTSSASAKQFLIDRIVAEAQRESAPLDEVEIGMLGFAEAEASAKQMELARKFEQKYQDEDYESRIARLARSAYDRDEAAGNKPPWDEALDELAAEDMYLFVMLEKAGIVKTTSHLVLPDWRLFLGLIPAVVCLALAILVVFTPIAARLMPNSYLRLGIGVLLLLAPFLLGKLRNAAAKK